ncbi:PIF1-like helicase-domain-containing protein [Fomitopsis betulina]|nr:PIF1-like helicase-domain-containing protein [Fomitopsis betulina]
MHASRILEPLRQSRQEATYSGSTHWQRHRNTTGQPWPTASSHESAPHFRRVSVKTEFNSLGTDARRFNVGPSRRNLHTAAGNPHVITLQQGGEIHDPNVVKREPSESLIHPVKEETQEAVLTEASKPGVGAIETTPSSWKAEDTVDTDSQTVIVEPPSPSIILSAEQQEVLDMVKSGQNVFFTGSAGTGKSVLLSEIIRARRGDLYSDRLAITAATGIAAVNIGGCTLHSWAGIGLGKESAEKLVGKFLGQDHYNREHWHGARAYTSTALRWRKVETLIIDEISMIDGVLFDKLVMFLPHDA